MAGSSPPGPQSPKVAVTISYGGPDAQPPVHLAGSFTNWELVLMDDVVAPDGKHCFSKELEVEQRAEYQYKFRLSTGEWVLDESAPTAFDESGNKNNILTVSDAAPAPEELSTDSKAPPPQENGNGVEEAHNPVIADLISDKDGLQDGTHTPASQVAKVAGEVADTARLLDPEESEPIVTDDEAGKTGFRRLSQTPIPQVADTAAEVADTARLLDAQEEDLSAPTHANGASSNGTAAVVVSPPQTNRVAVHERSDSKLDAVMLHEADITSSKDNVSDDVDSSGYVDDSPETIATEELGEKATKSTEETSDQKAAESGVPDVEPIAESSTASEIHPEESKAEDSNKEKPEAEAPEAEEHGSEKHGSEEPEAEEPKAEEPKVEEPEVEAVTTEGTQDGEKDKPMEEEFIPESAKEAPEALPETLANAPEATVLEAEDAKAEEPSQTLEGDEQPDAEVLAETTDEPAEPEAVKTIPEPTNVTEPTADDLVDVELASSDAPELAEADTSDIEGSEPAVSTLEETTERTEVPNEELETSLEDTDVAKATGVEDDTREAREIEEETSKETEVVPRAETPDETEASEKPEEPMEVEVPQEGAVSEINNASEQEPALEEASIDEIDAASETAESAKEREVAEPVGTETATDDPIEPEEVAEPLPPAVEEPREDLLKSEELNEVEQSTSAIPAAIAGTALAGTAGAAAIALPKDEPATEQKVAALEPTATAKAEPRTTDEQTESGPSKTTDAETPTPVVELSDTVDTGKATGADVAPEGETRQRKGKTPETTSTAETSEEPVVETENQDRALAPVSIHRKGNFFHNFFRALFVDLIGGLFSRLFGGRNGQLVAACAIAAAGFAWWTGVLKRPAVSLE